MAHESARQSHAPCQETPSLRPLAGGSLRALDDAALVGRARAGDKGAQELLYRRHASMVIGLAHRLLLRRDEVEEAAQDAFLIAFSRLAELRDPQAFAAWLGSIVIRVARTRIRRNTLLRRLGLYRGTPLDAEQLVSPRASPETATELRGLYDLVEALPANVRIALVLRRVEGRTVADVASHMGISESTAKRHIGAGEVLLTAHLTRGRQR